MLFATTNSLQMAEHGEAIAEVPIAPGIYGPTVRGRTPGYRIHMDWFGEPAAPWWPWAATRQLGTSVTLVEGEGKHRLAYNQRAASCIEGEKDEILGVEKHVGMTCYGGHGTPTQGITNSCVWIPRAVPTVVPR